MSSRTERFTVTQNGKTYQYDVRIIEEEHSGFQWIVYDQDGAHLYDECYDPDEVNPVDEAYDFAVGHAQENYI